MAAGLPHDEVLGTLSEDVFLGGRLTLRQPEHGLRGGLDGVFLAATAPVRVGSTARVLDVGAGAGLVGLALAARVADARVTLIEIEPALAALAEENARRNGLAGRVEVISADLTAPMQLIADAGAVPGTFDHVLANPPFEEEGRVRMPADALRARAVAMGPEGLERWARFLAAMTRPGGTATVILRADALGRLLAALESRFGELRVFPLFPRTGEAAIRILVQGVKGSRAPLALLPGMVLHDAKGRFTSAAEAILRDGAGLELRP